MIAVKQILAAFEFSKASGAVLQQPRVLGRMNSI
jgi:hypothetical protein